MTKFMVYLYKDRIISFLKHDEFHFGIGDNGDYLIWPGLVVTQVIMFEEELSFLKPIYKQKTY